MVRKKTKGKIDWQRYDDARTAKRLTITLPDDIRELAERFAAERGWSLSQTIRLAITRLCAESTD